MSDDIAKLARAMAYLSTVTPPGSGEDDPSRNEFERYPELAKHIELFANKATNLSIREWQAFTDALNNCLRALRAATPPTGD